MSLNEQARIIGVGSYLPERILTNQDLEKMVDTSDEWIVSRVGIKERRIAAAEEFPSDMGALAAKKALQSAGIAADQIDLIIVATISPDYLMPSTAALIQSILEMPNAIAFDINAACSGYLYALSVAKAFIESGMYRTILVIATEKISAFIDYNDRNTCVLFGDGAAAAVVSNQGDGFALGKFTLGTDGSLANLIAIPAGGARFPASQVTVEQGMHYFKMGGKETFKHAIRRMSAASIDCVDKAGLTIEQINWIVPHQANSRIIDGLIKSLSLSPEKVYVNVQKVGNTSAASIGIAFDQLIQDAEIASGAHVLLVGFGAGLTWGAVIATKIRMT